MARIFAEQKVTYQVKITALNEGDFEVYGWGFTPNAAFRDAVSKAAGFMGALEDKDDTDGG